MKELLVRNSEVSVFRHCRWEWEQSFNTCIEPRTSKPALRFGTLVHLALERYYIPGRKRGPHPAATFTALYAEESERRQGFGLYDNDEWVSAGDLGRQVLTNYVDRYGKDDHIEVIAPEMTFRVKVAHPKTGNYFCTAVGKLDIVYRDLMTGLLGIMDHKTAASISTGHLVLDDQAGQYWTFAPMFLKEQGILEPDAKLDHILYNFIRKAVPPDKPQDDQGRFLNKDGSVSKRQPPPFFLREKIWRDEHNAQEFLTRFINTVWEMQQVRKGKLPIYKTPTRDCTRCSYQSICELHESGSDWEELLSLDYQHRDPYSDHEINRKG